MAQLDISNIDGAKLNGQNASAGVKFNGTIVKRFNVTRVKSFNVTPSDPTQHLSLSPITDSSDKEE